MGCEDIGMQICGFTKRKAADNREGGEDVHASAVKLKRDVVLRRRRGARAHTHTELCADKRGQRTKATEEISGLRACHDRRR